MNNLAEMFSYSFMVRALVSGILISLVAALVGVPLVFRKNSMLGDGLSHVGFGAFALATVFGVAPIPVAIPIVILVSFLILRLDENSKIRGDSAVALMSVSALAIGTFIVSFMGVNLNIDSYLFGSILAVNSGEVWLAAIFSVIVISIYIVFHNKIFAITFDEKFARAIGINTKFYNMLFAILCSVVVVLGMRLMGALLISGLIIFPVLSAKILFKKFRSVVIASAIISVVNFIFGFVLSYYFSTPTSATIVVVNLLVLTILGILNKIIR